MKVHSDNFNVAVQALMLLHQLLLKNQAVSDRFYRALYSVLLSPSLTTSNKVELPHLNMNKARGSRVYFFVE